ncbi:MAG: Smr/MutS family protein [Deltaproteobacteria bacterium]|nr:Smr/MutS family protein [Deltaproteobacteria bacterium]
MRSLLRRLFGIVPTLDLHGLGVREALDETRAFLSEARARGEPQVRIVYGKGRGSPGGVGVLRQAVPAWIEQNAGDWVERFERQLDGSGNDGAMRVWLRPREDDDPG